MVGTMQSTPSHLATQWAGIVASICEALTPATLCSVAPRVEGGSQAVTTANLPIPEWASGCEDKREALRWDAS